MIGYSSEKDCAVLPALDYPLCPYPQENSFLFPYKTAMITSPFHSVVVYWLSLFCQDGWILALFFSIFMDLDYILVHRHAKEQGQYPAIWTLCLANIPQYLNYVTLCTVFSVFVFSFCLGCPELNTRYRFLQKVCTRLCSWTSCCWLVFTVRTVFWHCKSE